MSNITIIGDAHFVKFGSLIVRRGGAELLNVAAGEASLAQRLTIATNNQEWRPSDRLEIYLWSSQGSALISVIVGADLSPIDSASAAFPMDEEALNRLVATEVEGQGNTAADWLRALGRATAQLDEVPSAATRILAAGFDLSGRSALATELAKTPELADLAAQLLELDETLPVPNYEGDALFPDKYYFNESHARLIDMGGNKNLIVTMSSPDVPEILPLGSTPLETRGTGYGATGTPRNSRPAVWELAADPVIYDLALPTDRSALVSFTPDPHVSIPRPNLGYVIGDNYRNRHKKYWANNSGLPWDIEIESSPVADFTVNPSTVLARSPAPHYGSDYGDGLRPMSATIPARYMRVSLWTTVRWTEWNGGYIGPGPAAELLDPFTTPVNWLIRSTLANLVDNNVAGGSGKISLEVPNGAGGWQALTPTIALAQGRAETRQFGQANSSYVLPSGPRALRARMDIVGALQTAGAITLVS